MKELEGAYPVRLPVWWGRRGAAGPHPELKGVTGRFIVIRHPKKFKRFEGVIAKLLRAPKELRRPLDDMNSLLWELCDGTRSFQEVCSAMDSVFNEEIAPAVDRTAAGIDALKSRNLLTLLSEKYSGKWNIGPGLTPNNQTLGPIDESQKYDTEPRTARERPIHTEPNSQQVEQ